MAVKPIPDGYHSVTPYITVRGAADAIAFYQKAFGATEVLRLPMPDGSIAHAEVDVFGSKVMLADENIEWGNKSPATLGGASGALCVYVHDVDAVYAKAVEAGCKHVHPLADQFYGDRSGRVEDPFGQHWTLATHIEDVSPEEMQSRMEAWTASQSA